ncbi:MAG: hypothetical protein ACJ8CB_27090 [Ktedonobacteraceae bacterium]
MFHQVSYDTLQRPSMLDEFTPGGGVQPFVVNPPHHEYSRSARMASASRARVLAPGQAGT